MTLNSARKWYVRKKNLWSQQWFLKFGQHYVCLINACFPAMLEIEVRTPKWNLRRSYSLAVMAGESRKARIKVGDTSFCFPKLNSFVSKIICLQGVFKMEVILSTVLNLESVYPAICICVYGKSNILIWGLNLYCTLMYFSSDLYLRFCFCFFFLCFLGDFFFVCVCEIFSVTMWNLIVEYCCISCLFIDLWKACWKFVKTQGSLCSCMSLSRWYWYWMQLMLFPL